MKARIELSPTLWLLLALVVGKGLSFAPPHVFETRQCTGGGGRYLMLSPAASGCDASSTFCRQHSLLYSTPSEDDSEGEMTLLTKEIMSEARVTPPATVQTEPEDNTQPPIDLPSPLLLGTSMVLAIAGTGKLFLLCAVP